MFQTFSYIGILISELAQRTARRGSRNATKRRSKITYSIMTLAAKTNPQQPKKEGQTAPLQNGLPLSSNTAALHTRPPGLSQQSRTLAPNILCSERPSRARRNSLARNHARPCSEILPCTTQPYAQHLGMSELGFRGQPPPPGNGGSFSLATSTNSSALLHPRSRKCHLRHIFAQHP